MEQIRDEDSPVLSSTDPAVVATVGSDDIIEVTFEFNGAATTLRFPVRWTLADVLREKAGATGTHLGCEHGVCGACTVIVDGEPVRSCLMLAVQAEGSSVRTIEGLCRSGQLHPVQRAFHESHALQCGYCTPGFIMLSVGLLEREPDASEGRIRDVLSSNLCRCTGYRPILCAVRAAQRELSQ
jgi:aerobic carbon-monoxide dehydrogenase small subunit